MYWDRRHDHPGLQRRPGPLDQAPRYRQRITIGRPLVPVDGNANPNFYNIDIENRSLQVKVNAFAEAGLSYARVLFRNDKEEMKLGITGKYVLGLGYGSLSSGPIITNIDPANNIVNLQGNVTAQYSANLDNAGNGESVNDIIKKNAGHGVGLDIGFVYEIKGSDRRQRNCGLA